MKETLIEFLKDCPTDQSNEAVRAKWVKRTDVALRFRELGLEVNGDTQTAWRDQMHQELPDMRFWQMSLFVVSMKRALRRLDDTDLRELEHHPTFGMF